MSGTVKLKTPRTPEEKAAREARKASKKVTATIAETESVTGASAIAGPSSGADPATKQPKGVNEEDYEIDLAAPEPLSKAEIRLAKKRAKLSGTATGAGEAEVVPDKAELKKRKRVDPTYDPYEADKPEKAAKEKTKSQGDDEAGGREVKKQNSIWIGNLAFKTTPESLKEWIQKGVKDLGGKGECVTRVNLPKKPGKGGYGESRGFAYVDFVSPEMQKLAVGLSEGMLEGRKLLIKLGNDHTASESARTPKPAKSLLANPILRNQPNPESATLFMGNLPFDATEEAIRDLIEGNAAPRTPRDRDVNAAGGGAVKQEEEEEGEDAGAEDAEGNDVDQAVKEEQAYRGGRRSGLRKVRLGAFEDTGRCKGFAFLDFLDATNATAALANRRNHFFASRKLTLQYASEDAVKRAGGKRSRVGGDDAGTGPKRPRPSGGSDRRGAGPRSTRTQAANEDADGDDDQHTRPVTRDAAAIAREVLGDAADVDYEDEGPERRERKEKGDVRGKKWQAAGRPRPGAALAMAKREKVGIVPGQGKKISFD